MVDREAVQRVVDKLQPLFDAHGGRFEVVHLDDDGTLQVTLVGECEICALKDRTAHALKLMLDQENAGVTEIRTV
jgi:Fe-S cluster biogenesis protein NfuA